MNDVEWARPSEEDILKTWTTIFKDPFLSMAKLKSRALDGEIPQICRSLHWRFFFGLLPDPSPSPSSVSYSLLVSRARDEYEQYRSTYLRAPDGGWMTDESSSSTRTEDRTLPSKQRSINLDVNNPLGLDSDNPWKTWFADVELRKSVRQDVMRTFPDVEYFRSPEVQDRMTDILFIFCKLTPELSYRQGLHELLAPILWAVDSDSLIPVSNLLSGSNPLLADAPKVSLPHLVLSSKYIEHDTFALFFGLMKAAKPLYDFNSSVALPSTSVPAFLKGSYPSASFSPSLGRHSASNAKETMVQPIIRASVRIHDSLLHAVDPDLWKKLNQLKIEPQLFLLRWLRLLFSREFPFTDLLRIWDGIFAEDTTLKIAEYFCVAMLIRIRDAVLSEDYPGVLQLLLRYPSPPDGDHRIGLLLQQAILLRDNVSEAAGEVCRCQNMDFGASAGEINPDGIVTTPTSPTSRPVSSISRATSLGTNSHKKRSSESISNGMNLVGLFEGVGGIAKGVYGRAEALGLRTGVFIPETKRSSLSNIANRDSYAAELARMREANKRMGQALNLCVDAIEQGIAIPTPESSPKLPTKQSREETTIMAVSAVKHVRDVLLGNVKTFDEAVLSPLLSTLPEQRKPLDPQVFLDGRSSSFSSTNGPLLPLSTTRLNSPDEAFERLSLSTRPDKNNQSLDDKDPLGVL